MLEQDINLLWSRAADQVAYGLTDLKSLNKHWIRGAWELLQAIKSISCKANVGMGMLANTQESLVI